MASFLDSVFGAKPEVAPYTPTELPEEQLKAILGNIAAFPDIQKLGDLYQQYMMGGFQSAGLDINAILKGGSDMTKEMESMASDFLAGKIPDDVKNEIYRNDAFTSMLSGGPGGAYGLQARDLGRTSLDLIGQGANLAGAAGNAAQRWAGLASGLILNPNGMLITPQEQAQMTMQNRLYEQATQQLRNNVAAAPNPALQALNQWVEQVGGTIVGAYATGGMSKGGDYKTTYDASKYLGGPGGMPSDITTPGHYVTSPGSAFNSGGAPNLGYGNAFNPPTDSGYYGGYGGVAPSYYGIPENPFGGTSSTGGLDLWSQGAYQSNFPTSGGGF